MQRKLIFISSGILFIYIAAALVIIGSGEKDNIFIIISGMAIPFLFVGFWNIYNVFYEKKINYGDEYYTFKSGISSFGAGAFYNKKIIVPVFIIMFGTVSLAIVNAFLASSRSTEDIAIGVLGFSFLYALVLTIYFLKKINSELKTPINENSHTNNSVDDIGFKAAFFFATIATGGLFALGWWLYKKIKNKD